MSFFVEYGWAKAVEAEATAALPADAFGDAALFSLNHFVQARDAVANGVVAHFNADVAAAHLVRDGGGGAGAEEGVEDEVAGVGGDVEDALDEAFGFWCVEGIRYSEQSIYFFLGFLIMTDFPIGPPTPKILLLLPPIGSFLRAVEICHLSQTISALDYTTA